LHFAFAQENFFDDTLDESVIPKKAPVTPTYTKEVCTSMAASIGHMAQLPAECGKYPEAVREIQKKTKDSTPGASFLG
jgi:hypothetical protein